MTSLSEHQLWLEAHLALGKLEFEQGFQLSWRERSAFIREYIETHKSEFPMQEKPQ